MRSTYHASYVEQSSWSARNLFSFSFLFGCETAARQSRGMAGGRGLQAPKGILYSMCLMCRAGLARAHEVVDGLLGGALSVVDLRKRSRKKTVRQTRTGTCCLVCTALPSVHGEALRSVVAPYCTLCPFSVPWMEVVSRYKKVWCTFRRVEVTAEIQQRRVVWSRVSIYLDSTLGV